jgi:hypothetical protein
MTASGNIKISVDCDVKCACASCSAALSHELVSALKKDFFALAPTVNRRVPVRDVARRARRGATGRPSGTARDMPRDVAMARLRLGTDRS